jgi:hypothetical protein
MFCVSIGQLQDFPNSNSLSVARFTALQVNAWFALRRATSFCVLSVSGSFLISIVRPSFLPAQHNVTIGPTPSLEPYLLELTSVLSSV